MNIREINKPMTAASLNESLAKRFGKKINLEAFTLEQLEDARNRVRTTLSQYETNESFDAVHDEKYQKNKLFLDVLNAAVLEADVNEGEVPAALKAYQDKQAGKKPADKKAGKKPKDGKMPMDDNGTPDDKSDDKPAFLKKKNESKNIDEGKAIINNYFTSLLEGAEDKAELVMASKDMVDRVTGWMEDTAEMQAESMLELGDAIRDEMGQAESETFIGTVKPALESLYTALESTRAALTNGVAQITGEGGVPTPMGDEEPAMDAGMDAGMDAEMEPTIDAEDDFGGSEAAVGGEAEAGREKRESKIAKKKMIETSRRLGTILSTSK
jgi:hypothetical protein|tara:strand:+ start:2414 stop:3394 length:981 start_codon:yes stop_codon:yes gene_type:complete